MKVDLNYLLSGFSIFVPSALFLWKTRKQEPGTAYAVARIGIAIGIVLMLWGAGIIPF